jgi:RNA polymerase sigma-70 factor (ECF subfamily)
MATFKELKKEKSLVKHAIKGDMRALERLIIKYINFCYSISLTLLDNDKLAKDALEETLTYVYNNISELYDPRGFQVWLYDILKKSIEKCKQKGLDKTITKDPSKNNGSRTSSATTDLIQSNKLYITEKLLELMRKLPDEYREIVALIDFEGLSCNDVALLLGTDIMTVRTKLYKAKKFLKKAILQPAEKSMKSEVFKPVENQDITSTSDINLNKNTYVDDESVINSEITEPDKDMSNQNLLEPSEDMKGQKLLEPSDDMMEQELLQTPDNMTAHELVDVEKE